MSDVLQLLLQSSPFKIGLDILLNGGRHLIPKRPGIYLFVCKPTGQIYVGSASQRFGFYNRIGQHMSHLNIGKHHVKTMQQAFVKYGAPAFDWYVVEFCESDQALRREQFYLDLLQPWKPENGFNTQPNAFSPISCRKSAECKEKIAASKRGKPRPPDVVQRMSENRPQKSFTLVKDGIPVSGKNLAKFARGHGLNKGDLCAVVRGKKLHSQGWTLPENAGPMRMGKNWRASLGVN